jgi:hypothetical protein
MCARRARPHTSMHRLTRTYLDLLEPEGCMDALGLVRAETYSGDLVMLLSPHLRSLAGVMCSPYKKP